MISPEIIGLAGIVLLLIFLAMRMWIGAATAIVGILGIICIRGLHQASSLMEMVPYQNSLDYSLTAMPMFILMGMIIAVARIGSDMYAAAHKWVGGARGGLASATVLACAGIGAITGASTTGIMVLSKVALPEMEKYKYDDRLSIGSIAAGSSLSALIPPSVPFILYGIMTETSVGSLFIAGIVPGLLGVAVYIATIYTLCLINPRMGPPGPKTSLKEKIVSLRKIWSTLALFVLVIGGIYGGLFTPTEAGAVGTLGAIAIGLFSRQLSFKGFVDSVMETGKMTGSILIMIIGVAVFSSFMTVSKLPMWLGNFIVGVDAPRVVILIFIVILFLVLGTFMPAPAIIMLTMPVLFPVIKALGVDPIWFGVLVVKATEIGSLTPPIGINCILLSGLSGVQLSRAYKSILPFLAADFAIVALLIAFPVLSTYLPSLM
ncbi:MAG: TRAP transporter large permease [Firmicutes bacterium]|nr:TRAP transporter large permease [Bacillota bacterium]